MRCPGPGSPSLQHSHEPRRPGRRQVRSRTRRRDDGERQLGGLRQLPHRGQPQDVPGRRLRRPPAGAAGPGDVARRPGRRRVPLLRHPGRGDVGRLDRPPGDGQRDGGRPDQGLRGRGGAAETTKISFRREDFLRLLAGKEAFTLAVELEKRPASPGPSDDFVLTRVATSSNLSLAPGLEVARPGAVLPVQHPHEAPRPDRLDGRPGRVRCRRALAGRAADPAAGRVTTSAHRGPTGGGGPSPERALSGARLVRVASDRLPIYPSERTGRHSCPDVER